MKEIVSVLIEEKNMLKHVVHNIERRQKQIQQLNITGNLRIAYKKGKPNYYLVQKGEKIGRYMKKEELSIAKVIAQRDYDMQILKNAKGRIRAIENFLKKYNKTDLKKIYNKTHQHRREMIEIDIISDEEYVRRWSIVKYKGKGGIEEQKIVTERGESVRSKSEKIIADKLYMLGIPYRYEYPLVLGCNLTVYPDFTILKMPERKEVYFEHFGMLDDEEYFDKMLVKLNTYEKNGIYLGVNLFVSYETSRSPLNIKALNSQLRELFC